MNTKLNALKAEFKNTFFLIAPHKNRLNVFSDFIFCMAASYNNAIHLSNNVENEYLK